MKKKDTKLEVKVYPKGSEPAFPTTDITYPSGEVAYGAIGLSKREYMATAAMKGLLTYVEDGFSATSITREMIASDAVKMADALLAELEKSNE